MDMRIHTGVNPNLVRPAPAIPSAHHPGLPYAVVAILREAHAHHLSMAEGYQRDSAQRSELFPGGTRHYRQSAIRHAAKATAVVQALRDAGHDRDADELRECAKALEETLYAVPEDMLERMELLDMAVPGAVA